MRQAWLPRSKNGVGTSPPRFNSEKFSPVSAKSSSGSQNSTSFPQHAYFSQVIGISPLELMLLEQASSGIIWANYGTRTILFHLLQFGTATPFYL
jgi:hypothetical protein